jgi:acyl-CoA synthetase (AMP-forming)/AMP-acid ligase II/NAD(P)-dependent dehydrogenase (short-subunit alcohol dehydrogenase family)
VLDCAAVDRRAAGTEHTVAYVVTSAGGHLGSLHDAVAPRMPKWVRSLSLVRVSALPVDGRGELDRAALETVPVLDRVVAEGCLAALSGNVTGPPAADPPAVVIQPSRRDLPRWTIPDPADAHRTGSAGPGSSGRAAVSTAAERAPAPPSVLEGGEGLERDGLRLIGDALHRAAEDAPEHGILFPRGDGTAETITYPELLERSRRVGRGLRAAGLRPGDEVLLQLGRTEDFLPALWGVVDGGFVAVPLAFAPDSESPARAASLLAHAWKLASRPVVLTDGGSVEELRRLGAEAGCDWELLELERCIGESGRGDSPPAAPDDTAIILLTSGSTGAAKGVMLSHRNLLSSVLGSADVNGFTRREVSLNWLPLSHIGALMRSLREVVLGARQIQMETRAVLEDPIRWLDAMDRFGVTTSWAPNFAFSLVVEQGDRLRGRDWDFGPLRSLWTSGESIASKMMLRFQELLEPHGLELGDLHTAWGMTEACFATFSHDYMVRIAREGRRVPDVGRPIPGVSMRIADDRNRVVPQGVEGRLQIRGPVVTKGYVQPEAEEEARTGDGWLDTGDLGAIEDGRLTISGRRKDVIIVNGVNYAPREIESVVEEVDGVERSFTAACGVRGPDDDTDALAIFFHPRGGTSALDSLLASIRDRVSRGVGLAPTYLVPVERAAIPKTPVGKIQRSVLRARFAAGELDDDVRVFGAAPGVGSDSVPAWFYRRVWRPRRLRPGPAPDSGRTLAFVRPDGLGRALTGRLESWEGPCVVAEEGARFERLGAGRYRVDPADREQCLRLADEILADGGPIRRVVHALACSAPEDPSGAGGLDEWPGRPVRSLLEPLRALTEHPTHPTDARVLVAVTAGTAVDPGDPVDPLRAPLAGLVSTLSSEVLGLGFRLVDLPPDEPEACAARLAEELLDLGREREVAYRGGRRLVPRLESPERGAAVPSSGAPPFVAGGRYLLCGRSEGLGAALARLLVDRFGARVAVADRDAVAGAAGEAGAFETVDPGDLERSVRRLEELWGAPLDGVVHVADLGPGDDPMEVLDQRFPDHLSRAAEAIGELEALVARRPGASFLRIGGVGGVFGEPGSGRSAAIAGLSGALAQRRRRAGAPSRLLLLAPCATGTGAGRSAFLQARGFLSPDPDQALRSLCWALDHGTEEELWLIGVDGRNPHVRDRVDGDLHATEELVVYAAPDGEPGGERTNAVDDLFGVPAPYRIVRSGSIPRVKPGTRLTRAPSAAARGVRRDQHRSAVEEGVSRAFRGALGLERIGRDENFFELGGGSLHVVRVIGRLRETFPDRAISSPELFRYPTVKELADHLEGAARDGSQVARGRRRAAMRRRGRSRRGRSRE